MKKFLLSFIIIAAGFSLQAQDLAQDQNPNYKTSMEKYMTMQPDLQSTMNTTVHNTYKAYDWTTAKAERKTARRNERREDRLYNQRSYDNYYARHTWDNNNYYGGPRPYYGRRW